MYIKTITRHYRWLPLLQQWHCSSSTPTIPRKCDLFANSSWQLHRPFSTSSRYSNMFSRSDFSSSSRDLLLDAYHSAVHAVKPNSLISDSIRVQANGVLNIWERHTQQRHQVALAGRDVYIFGAGKAVLGMCEELLAQIDYHNNTSSPADKENSAAIIIQCGRLNVPVGTKLSNGSLLERYRVTVHPCARNNMPDVESARNTKAILDMLDQVKGQSDSQRPLVIGFVSGGGSALLSLPKPNITVDDKRSLIRDLVRHGADIVELNTVRSALSEVKHGQLAARLGSGPRPFELVTFIISDIINDPLDKIASGPTVIPSDISSVSESSTPSSILSKYRINPPKNVLKILQSESGKNIQNLNRDLVRNIIIGNNSIALAAAKAKLEQGQFKVIECGSNIAGEAGEVVRGLIQRMVDHERGEGKGQRGEHDDCRGICWLAGGETTVNMKSSAQIGLGGRCQEMGLAFLHEMLHTQDPCLKHVKLHALFAGTDGQDGPTPSAGVLLSWPLQDSNSQLKPGPLEDALACHNSHNYFRCHMPNGLIETGVSGTNVMDIYCLMYEF